MKSLLINDLIPLEEISSPETEPQSMKTSKLYKSLLCDADISCFGGTRLKQHCTRQDRTRPDPHKSKQSRKQPSVRDDQAGAAWGDEPVEVEIGKRLKRNDTTIPTCSGSIIRTSIRTDNVWRGSAIEESATIEQQSACFKVFGRCTRS